jgi:hypothetical protein
MSTRSPAFASTDELVSLISEYERGTLPRERWDHPAHLAAAIWYLSRLPEREATETFIASILRYNRLNGIEMTEAGGYNETLTLFWLALAQEYLVASDSAASLLQLANDFIDLYGHRPQQFLEYYSPERIWSWRARQSWVEPDLKTIDGGFSRKAKTG